MYPRILSCIYTAIVFICTIAHAIAIVGLALFLKGDDLGTYPPKDTSLYVAGKSEFFESVIYILSVLLMLVVLLMYVRYISHTIGSEWSDDNSHNFYSGYFDVTKDETYFHNSTVFGTLICPPPVSSEEPVTQAEAPPKRSQKLALADDPEGPDGEAASDEEEFAEGAVGGVALGTAGTEGATTRTITPSEEALKKRAQFEASNLKKATTTVKVRDLDEEAVKIAHGRMKPTGKSDRSSQRFMNRLPTGRVRMAMPILDDDEDDDSEEVIREAEYMAVPKTPSEANAATRSSTSAAMKRIQSIKQFRQRYDSSVMNDAPQFIVLPLSQLRAGTLPEPISSAPEAGNDYPTLRGAKDMDSFVQDSPDSVPVRDDLAPSDPRPRDNTATSAPANDARASTATMDTQESTNTLVFGESQTKSQAQPGKI